MENTTQATNTTQTRSIGSYNGKYHEAQSDLFNKLQSMFGLTESQADTIAFRFASDFGKLTAGVKADVKLGKVNGKGLGSLKESLNAKKVTFTMVLKIARAVQWADEANANFVSHGFTNWKLNADCQEFVDGL